MAYLSVEPAARAVVAGGVIGYPTEGVYGLGCLPFARDAVERILAIKGRSAKQGFILIAQDIGQLEHLIRAPAQEHMQSIADSWPGPHTWIFDAAPGVPAWLTGGRRTLAVRITDHPVAAALCRRTGSALVSTSANRHGQAPLRTAAAVRRRFGRLLDHVLPGPLGGLTGPTAIRDARTGAWIRKP